jgi:hypothetical protein
VKFHQERNPTQRTLSRDGGGGKEQ